MGGGRGTSDPAGGGAGPGQEDALNRLVLASPPCQRLSQSESSPPLLWGLEEAEPPVTLKANRESGKGHQVLMDRPGVALPGIWPKKRRFRAAALRKGGRGKSPLDARLAGTLCRRRGPPRQPLKGPLPSRLRGRVTLQPGPQEGRPWDRLQDLFKLQRALSFLPGRGLAEGPGLRTTSKPSADVRFFHQVQGRQRAAPSTPSFFAL